MRGQEVAALAAHGKMRPLAAALVQQQQHWLAGPLRANHQIRVNPHTQPCLQLAQYGYMNDLHCTKGYFDITP